MTPITLRNLTKRFGDTTAVDAIDLDIPAGDLFFLLGPSGCGKTTLLRMLAGFSDPTAGTIRFGNDEVTHTPPNKRDTGMVFQSYALWPHMDVAGNVAFGLRARGLSPEARAARVTEALGTVGLDGFARRRIASLSGGQRQRVALARCLALRPRLLLLDEPLANLDTHLRDAMIDEFRRLHRATGTSIIHVTHDQSEAMLLADRIAVMGQGRLLQVDTPSRLWREPATPEVARFVGKGQVLPVEVDRPGPKAAVRIFGHAATLRARHDIARGPALAALRTEDTVRDDTGLRARVVDRQDMGAAVAVTIELRDSPGTLLRLHRPHDDDCAPGQVIGVRFRDGWVIGAGNAYADPAARADMPDQACVPSRG